MNRNPGEVAKDGRSREYLNAVLAASFLGNELRFCSTATTASSESGPGKDNSHLVHFAFYGNVGL